jgi:m7GpppX diphosphatase
MTVRRKFAEIKTTVILPATEALINKYRMMDQFLIEETPDDYRELTLKFVEQNALSLEVRGNAAVLLRLTVGVQSTGAQG